jgi:hypothetical protein
MRSWSDWSRTGFEGPLQRIGPSRRPRDAFTLPGSGRWQNGEVAIRVLAGKETVPPPLRWEPDVPERKPAAAAHHAPIAPVKKPPASARRPGGKR